MKRTEKKTETKPCPILGCWNRIPLTKHLCEACTSWWYRVSMKDPRELAEYIRRMGRYAGRLQRIGKSERVGGGKSGLRRVA